MDYCLWISPARFSMAWVTRNLDGEMEMIVTLLHDNGNFTNLYPRYYMYQVLFLAFMHMRSFEGKDMWFHLNIP